MPRRLKLNYYTQKPFLCIIVGGAFELENIVAKMFASRIYISIIYLYRYYTLGEIKFLVHSALESGPYNAKCGLTFNEKIIKLFVVARH